MPVYRSAARWAYTGDSRRTTSADPRLAVLPWLEKTRSGLPPLKESWAITAKSGSAARSAAIATLVLTVGQLLVASFATGLPQFTGKGFGARLVAYPPLMLAVPVAWALHRRSHPSSEPLPWAGFALIMAPFLIDVTGNTLNLYDSLAWWDDANHLVNWFLLCAGIGILLLPARITPTWALGWLVAGVDALLAIGWELAEWYAFIRHGTELDTAYQDTLGDQALGTLGAALAGALVGRRSTSTPTRPC